MTRESWKSKTGFIFAALGSAVGLANICLFPFLVGKYGGAAFIFVYLFCLLVIGYPVFLAEIYIGKKSKSGAASAYYKLSGRTIYKWLGKIVVFTGLVVSAFYSVLAGTIVMYSFLAFRGDLSALNNMSEATELYSTLTKATYPSLFFHGLFTFLCMLVMFGGVREGIERCSKVFMPLLMALLAFLFFKGLYLPHADRALRFLFEPKLTALSWEAILAALGQSFFTLSLGQGTMVAYGSYLKSDEKLFRVTLPILLGDTLISICSAVIVFTLIFAVGMEDSASAGLGLLFQTLPLGFNQMAAGASISKAFFLFILLAAITSQISVMETVSSYFSDEWQLSRKRAVCLTGLSGFLLGLPCALATGFLADYQIFSLNFMDFAQELAQKVLIPFGGLVGVTLLAWSPSLDELLRELFPEKSRLELFFRFVMRYTAPFLIICVWVKQFL